MVKIDTVYDFTDKGLGELKAWLEPWFRFDDRDQEEAAPATEPFFDAMMEIAATRDLRGYWRLGEGGFGPYADSKPAGAWNNVPMSRDDNTVDMSDIDPGALPADQDDGAVQFNSSTGAITSDYLVGLTNWGAISNNPFDTDMGTIAGWVKPFASASTFDGGLFTMLGYTGLDQGYVVGVAWPARTVFHQRGATRLTGPVLAADEWAFVVGVKDATSTRIYVDGALVATGAAVSGTPGTNSEPKIGLWNHSAGTTPGLGVFYGAIDEVSVWADTLTDEEIATLAASGGLAVNPDVRSVINTVGAYTASPGDTVFANGTFTVTLPTAVGNRGAEIIVKNTGAGTITVAQAGSETVDGSTIDLTLATKDSVILVSDASGWQIVGGYSYP